MRRLSWFWKTVIHKQAEFDVNLVDIFSNHWLEKIEIYLTVPPLCKFSFLPILKL